MTESELHCVDVVELVTAYLEGALDADTRERFELHVEQECPGCREYLGQVRKTRAALAEPEPVQPLSPEVRDGLLAAFRERPV